ncbi:MAG: alpha/beta hydrolase [Novosphingobium sp.]|nr:alpha/beta hydrolase [Novosphingobium sp.]
MPSEELAAVVAAIRKEERERGGSRLGSVRPSVDDLISRKAAMNANYLPIQEGVSHRDGSVGGIPGVWFEPEGADRSRVILYCHGGGFMFGSPINTGHVTARLARETGCLAFSLDYRLSHEAPFPAPVEDALAAYRGLLDEGFAPASIAIAGDSAGGGLAVLVMVAARDAGLPLPAACLSSSPWTDLEMTGASIAENEATDVHCHLPGLRMMAQAYLAGADPRDPRASLIHADLSGLPRLLVQTGGAEVLRDDGVRLAERARVAGVDVTLDVIEGAVHIWQYVAPDAPETAKSEAEAGAFLKAAMDRAGQVM